MPRTKIEKIWLGGAVAVALLLAVIGYFFLIGPQRAKTHDVRGQVADAQLQTTTLQSRIISLTSEQKQLASFRAKLAEAQKALPTLDDLSANPALLRSLQKIARQSSTSVSSLTIGDPTAVAAPAATSTSTASPAPSSSSASATSTAPVGSTTTTATSLYSVDITASVSGSTNGLTGFLTRLQQNQPRAVLISGVTMGGATGTGSRGEQTMSLTMTAFVRPSAAAAAATTGLPGTTATPTTTDTP
ncbi:hypothetical protein [Jatrophihabitans endophyticus]|uniref:hypothetical protein n=1 Tax=Jatrophihabitans endophyticus TaxID=1206085 RepID=UPI0019F09E67|nr:hypothetical protein [Jatrophihabitans endophyticus]MBE7190416.1 hypothetical protein [Jatrophihabitans endophyticus]